MMKEQIEKFAEQFAYQPEIANAGQLQKKEHFVVSGMGGSGLAAKLLLAWDPSLPILVHQDYGLPAPLSSGSGKPAVASKDAGEHLFIFNTYSGNTEEVLSGYDEAKRQKLSMATVATGGKVLEKAKEDGIPYVQLPDWGLQPRMSLGLQARALLALIGRGDLLDSSAELATALKPSVFEAEGKELAKTLEGRVPIIYSSARNFAVAYTWKIKFNETGKIPAFYNVFSELNHNEMTGFDAQESNRALSKSFHFIFLKDDDDHPHIKRRMEVLEQMYGERNFPVAAVRMEGVTRPHKIFSSLMVADWTAYYLAEHYGTDPEQVPMVEEFKKLIA